MSDKWYYVLSGERKGPVELSAVIDLYQGGSVNAEDYVWKKGMDNWSKIKDTSEFSDHADDGPENPQEMQVDIPEEIIEEVIEEDLIEEIVEFNLSSLDQDTKTLYIKTGSDRGGAEAEYGPFSINILTRLFEENRVNTKTFVFSKGMPDWQQLGSVLGFEQVFEGIPPQIEESDKRTSTRKPLIARMFIQNNQQVFEGICRDVSVGGMQVLVDHFPGDVGEKISINVHPENTDYHFVAAGNIVRLLEGGQGFSFRFSDLSDDSRNSIESYISQE